MKIAFVGNFGVDYSSESHYLKTFAKLGHEVVTIQENRPVPLPVNEYANCDFLFWVHTHGWETPGIEPLLELFKSQGKPIVGYHLDLWKGLHREADLKVDLYWKRVTHFFTCDKQFISDLEAMGIKAFYLPAGVFEGECYMAEPNREKYPHDIIFTGSKDYHEEWPYRVRLIDWLQETYGDKFKLYGREKGKDYNQIRGHELNVLYASAKLVIGDTLCQGFNYPDYFSDRLFEVTGRGGALIFPFIRGIDKQFILFQELVTYGFDNFEHLKMHIDFFLANEPEREKIRKAGFERTKRDHTYTKRLSDMINIIFPNNESIESQKTAPGTL